MGRKPNTLGSDGGWYWCLRHGRVERGAESCPADVRMGPYPSKEAAASWRDRVEARNEQWDAEERAWNGGEGDNP